MILLVSVECRSSVTLLGPSLSSRESAFASSMMRVKFLRLEDKASSLVLRMRVHPLNMHRLQRPPARLLRFPIYFWESFWSPQASQLTAPTTKTQPASLSSRSSWVPVSGLLSPSRCASCVRKPSLCALCKPWLQPNSEVLRRTLYPSRLAPGTLCTWSLICRNFLRPWHGLSVAEDNALALQNTYDSCD